MNLLFWGLMPKKKKARKDPLESLFIVRRGRKSNRDKAVDTLWRTSDDAIGTMRNLSEIYDDVPKELDVSVWVDEFHKFDCSKEIKKKVIAWLNKKCH